MHLMATCKKNKQNTTITINQMKMSIYWKVMAPKMSNKYH